MITIRKKSQGLSFIVHITPSARQELIYFRSDHELGIKVKAPAQENKANLRVIYLLSLFLDIAKSNILIIKGEQSRKKEILVKNITYDYIINKLQNLKS